MLRSIFRLFALATVIWTVGTIAPARAAASVATDSGWSLGSILVWAIGLVCGVALTSALQIEWRTLPERVWHWFRYKKDEVQWAAFAVVCVCVIVLY